jgi:putative DNA-invertase from lambdoid prophage Rac
MQLAAMRDYARKRGWHVVVEVKDVASGAALRQKREELLAAARRRDIDLVVVWRLDRWGRSLVDLVNTLQELVSLKVGFVSLSEALDLTTASGRALAGMLAVLAEFERDILRDRVKAGYCAGPKRGKTPRQADYRRTTPSRGQGTLPKGPVQAGNREADWDQ